MTKLLKLNTSFVATLLLILSCNNANAALVNYVITGDVVYGDEDIYNVFGLTAGDTITATGVFDDSVLTSGDGSIDFSSGSGNTMTIYVGTEIFNAANDTGFGTGGGPNITLNSLSLTNFDFFASTGINGAAADFSSYFAEFDDLDGLYGEWRTTIEITAVPVPAAAWLFGSGLIGLAGVARRKAS